MSKKALLPLLCIAALFTTGCSEAESESNSSDVPQIVVEEATTEAAPTDVVVEETVEETTEESIEASDVELETEELPTSEEDAEITEMAIDLTQKALAALKERDTDCIMTLTTYPMLYYYTTGKDPVENEEDLKSRFEESNREAQNGNLFDFLSIFEGEFTIDRVEHTPEMKETFMAYIEENLETTDEGTLPELERYAIDDVITVYGTMTQPDGNSDTGMVFLFETNGDWFFDAVYSFEMEMEGKWQNTTE